MTGLVVDKIQTAKLTLQVTDSLARATYLVRLCKLAMKQSTVFVRKFFVQEFTFPNLDLLANNVSDSDIFSNLKSNLKGDLRYVTVDPEIGEAKLKQLANNYEAKNKCVVLNLPYASELPQNNKLVSWNLKRLFDWFAALIILIAFSPVMLILSTIIALTSSGPIFFQQWRVGENGRLFRIIKFRTMITDADKLHHLVMSGQTGLHKCEDDPRVTSVGRWMRKYSLDELPQLFNVLRGEMSLVGPRPWALYDALRISGDGKRRLNSLPGVTGAWQVSARSTMLDLDAVTECDLSYLRNWTIWSDLKILLMTVPKVLSGFGAF